MANHALAIVEAALRARQLDRTLTTALPQPDHAAAATVATDVAALDVCLRGGLPRGQLSEITGPQSSGRTTLLLQLVAAATRRGEIAALVDTFDRLDTASAVAANVELDRLLWIRGHDIRPRASGLGAQGCLRPQTWPSPEARGLSPGALLDRTIDHALKALNLVLQAGGFGVVAIDLADAPLAALTHVPFTTWLRIQRVIEGSDTACVIVAPQPLARSAGGLTLSVTARPQWTSSFLAGLDVAVRVVSPRRRVDGEITIGAQVHGCSGA